MHGVVTYLFVIPLFPRGPWPLACGLPWFACGGVSCFLCFGVRVFPFVLFPSFLFFDAHKPPSSYGTHFARWFGARNFKFFVVAACLFLASCVCPKFYDLAKQRRKIFWGVSEVGKNDFSVHFCRLCVFFLGFFFSAAIARDVYPDRFNRSSTGRTDYFIWRLAWEFHVQPHIYGAIFEQYNALMSLKDTQK